MLTWMQHHKKYLVVTIWISVIAFVGAGFVGWGAYDFNLNRSSSVAMVGDEKITFGEFNTRFNQIFSYYNQISNGTLDDENFKKNIENMTLASLIEDKLLLSFAKNLGLSSNENEILQELANTPAFQNENGEFNKSIYYELLRRNDISPKDYEHSLANEIIINKLNQIFNLPQKEEELKMLASSYFMRDSLSIETIDLNKKDIKINEEELKKLWEEHKADFKTQKIYEISSYVLKADKQNYDDKALRAFYDEEPSKYKDFNGKILSFEEAKDDVIKAYALNQLKKTANEKFLELKEGKIAFEKDLNITDSDVYYPLELLERAKNGDVLRPFEFAQGYNIIKLNQKDPTRIKTFEEAREEVLPLYLSQKAQELLKQKAQKALNDFKGENIGLLSRDSGRDPQKVDEENLNDAEFSYFLMNVFNSEQNKSYVLLNDNKAILYKINSQKLSPNSDKMAQIKTMLEQNLRNLKANEIKQELIEELKKEYKVKIYYKGTSS